MVCLPKTYGNPKDIQRISYKDCLRFFSGLLEFLNAISSGTIVLNKLLYRTLVGKKEESITDEIAKEDWDADRKGCDTMPYKLFEDSLIQVRQ